MDEFTQLSNWVFIDEISDGGTNREDDIYVYKIGYMCLRFNSLKERVGKVILICGK